MTCFSKWAEDKRSDRVQQAQRAGLRAQSRPDGLSALSQDARHRKALVHVALVELLGHENRSQREGLPTQDLPAVAPQARRVETIALYLQIRCVAEQHIPVAKAHHVPLRRLNAPHSHRRSEAIQRLAPLVGCGLGHFGNHAPHRRLFARAAKHVERRQAAAARNVAVRHLALGQAGQFAKNPVSRRGRHHAFAQTENLGQQFVFTKLFRGLNALAAHQQPGHQGVGAILDRTPGVLVARGQALVDRAAHAKRAHRLLGQNRAAAGRGAKLGKVQPGNPLTERPARRDMSESRSCRVMGPRKQRVQDAFAHREPDRTPLFEIFQPFHPIHWIVCGRKLMTDMALTWDAMAEGVAFEELVEAEARVKIDMAECFGLDIIHAGAANAKRDFERPVKAGPKTWRRGGVDYELDERRGMIFPRNPRLSLHQTMSEEAMRREVEEWDGTAQPPPDDTLAVFLRAREIAAERGLDVVFMGEQGAGTAPAFYPPFQLLWALTEPDLLRRWIERQAAQGFVATDTLIDAGCAIIAMGGDVASDKGPFISPGMYREFILPVVREHIRRIQAKGAYAVYTSDGNLWALKDEIFFESGADGYKEVDYGAGMTMERLIAEGVKERLCVLGNLDARHTLCNKTPNDARAFVRRCLDLGRHTPGGHILHASHSVHEDVKTENYIAAVAAYRE